VCGDDMDMAYFGSFVGKLAGTGGVRGNGRNPRDRYLLGTMNPKIIKMVRALVLGGRAITLGVNVVPDKTVGLIQLLVGVSSWRRDDDGSVPNPRSRHSGPAHINETKAIVQGIEEAEPYLRIRS